MILTTSDPSFKGRTLNPGPFRQSFPTSRASIISIAFIRATKEYQCRINLISAQFAHLNIAVKTSRYPADICVAGRVSLNTLIRSSISELGTFSPFKYHL